MKNKVVVITGSSSGIGKETAIEFCKQGASVLINGRNPERLNSTYEELKTKGYQVEKFAGDITDITDCRAMINRAIQKFGKIDVLINNGSVSMEDYFEDLQPEVFKEVMMSNSYGAALPSLIALPYIRESKGSIVFISSLAGILGVPYASAYSAGKMALTGLAQSLRIELSCYGVHIGVCYVSFTRNDCNKMVLNSDGSMKRVAPRPGFIQQSQRKVARSIINIVKFRKRRKVLSLAGNCTAFMMRRFPFITEKMMTASIRRKRKRELMA